MDQRSTKFRCASRIFLKELCALCSDTLLKSFGVCRQLRNGREANALEFASHSRLCGWRLFPQLIREAQSFLKLFPIRRTCASNGFELRFALRGGLTELLMKPL